AINLVWTRHEIEISDLAKRDESRRRGLLRVRVVAFGKGERNSLEGGEVRPQRFRQPNDQWKTPVALENLARDFAADRHLHDFLYFSDAESVTGENASFQLNG